MAKKTTTAKPATKATKKAETKTAPKAAPKTAAKVATEAAAKVTAKKPVKVEKAPTPPAPVSETGKKPAKVAPKPAGITIEKAKECAKPKKAPTATPAPLPAPVAAPVAEKKKRNYPANRKSAPRDTLCKERLSYAAEYIARQGYTEEEILEKVNGKYTPEIIGKLKAFDKKELTRTRNLMLSGEIAGYDKNTKVDVWFDVNGVKMTKEEKKAIMDRARGVKTNYTPDNDPLKRLAGIDVLNGLPRNAPKMEIPEEPKAEPKAESKKVARTPKTKPTGKAKK